MQLATNEALLHIDRLTAEFPTRRGKLKAVDGVSLRLASGKALGLVGESGSGKSVTGLSMLRLIRPPGRITGGRIVFEGADLLAKTPSEMRALRGARMAMIFQDPSATLNPVLTIGLQLTEQLQSHDRSMGRAAARARAIEVMEQVGIPGAAARLGSYPYEFSGGMLQRVVIAAALLLSPALIVADEPTTALDVTIQAQILDLLHNLKDGSASTAILLISHDLGVIAQICGEVAVMYAGTIVEMGPTDEILARPVHPYTIGLVQAIPTLEPNGLPIVAIPGAVPDMTRPPPGCPFHPRCAVAVARCRQERPQLSPIGPGRSVACHVASGTA
jgi:oligopeptide/dipeptide ABC transporter ATP-binding protein